MWTQECTGAHTGTLLVPPERAVEQEGAPWARKSSRMGRISFTGGNRPPFQGQVPLYAQGSFGAAAVPTGPVSTRSSWGRHCETKAPGLWALFATPTPKTGPGPVEPHPVPRGLVFAQQCGQTLLCDPGNHQPSWSVHQSCPGIQEDSSTTTKRKGGLAPV